MYHIIINQKSKSGIAAHAWNIIEPVLLEKKIPYSVYFTARRKHASQISAEINSVQEPYTLIVLGGDGTINEVVNGLANLSLVTLGYIPLGSGNDFARSLRLKNNILHNLNLILEKKSIKTMDVGSIACDIGSGKLYTRKFVISSGVGFDAAVCHQAAVSKWKVLLNRLKLGKLTYAFVALHRLFKDKTNELTITFEDGKSIFFPKTYFVAFMNHRYEGGGFMFAPTASFEDGALDVVIASNISRVKILFLLPLAFLGLHAGFKGVHIFKGNFFSLKSSSPLPLHTDGEPMFFRKQVTVSVFPEKLQIITQ